MANPETLKLRHGNGVIDAAFSLRTTDGSTFEIAWESRGSGRRRGETFTRNPEYARGLEVLLERIAAVAATLDDCLVDSATVRTLGLGDDERRVDPAPHYRFPISLGGGLDVAKLRLALTAPQAAVASTARTGGNPTKKILLRFTARRPGIGRDEIIDALDAQPETDARRSRRDIATGLSAEHVDAALAEWRSVGPDAFHARYGTHPADRYVIADPDGTEYDAKAILIGSRAHAGLDGENAEFAGDRHTVAAPLIALGYVVDDLTGHDDLSAASSDSDRAKAIERARKFAGDTDATTERRVRREQGLLRRALGLGSGSNQCSICGRTYPDALLVAAHIKKRSECSHEERTDIPDVAFVACTLGCDALFESGHITVDDGGVVIDTGSAEGPHLQEAVDQLAGRTVTGVSSGSSKYFAWHRARWGAEATG